MNGDGKEARKQHEIARGGVREQETALSALIEYEVLQALKKQATALSDALGGEGMKWGGQTSRRRSWGYEEPVTRAEHDAFKATLVAMLVLLFVAAVTVFGEQILDLLRIGVR